MTIILKWNLLLFTNNGNMLRPTSCPDMLVTFPNEGKYLVGTIHIGNELI